MSSSFIKQEKLSSVTQILALNWKFFRSLTLFVKVLPASMTLVILACAAPSVFRWYAGNYSAQQQGFTLSGLSMIVILSAVFRIVSWALFEIPAMWAAQGLFSKMLEGLSHTYTTFFDENPSGRILNRLVRDYQEARLTAVISAGDFLNALIELASIVVVASFASGWVALMVVPFLGVFLFIQAQRSVMVERARGWTAVAASQVLNRQNDLIEGRQVFVLYGKTGLLLDRMWENLRGHLRVSCLTQQIDNWASFWIRFSAEVFGLGVMLFIIDSLRHHRIEAPIAGVIISALFGITGTVGWLDNSSNMVSRSAPHLRRIIEYIELPREDSFQTVLVDPESTLGDIVFDRYSMAYREGLPLILKDLNLTIPSGSHVALVGRTGSGKSSVIQALLRMVWVQSGEIWIGNQSIADMDIHELRRLFGVVPQFPYLFAGTIASNLDRTRTLPEIALVKALGEVGLNYTLDYKIDEGGANLSLGERQLVCLARVIASNKQIILMDEPTSGLDPRTDASVIRLLNTALKGKTVLTIAHRRETVLGYDLTIEMRDGRVY